MREFFRGWRRKVGCVLLLMALFWAREWTLSYLGGSMINLSRANRIVCLKGCVTLVMMNSGGDYILPWIRDANGDTAVSPGNNWSQEWRRTFAGLELGCDLYGAASQEVDRARWYRVPHWFIVLPLTLLSAYLMLWKPRNRAIAEGCRRTN